MSSSIRNNGPNTSKARWRELMMSVWQTTLGQWIAVFALIFGGCCSNAWALELATSENPRSGSLITFAQFLLVTLVGLPRQLTVKPAPCSRDELINHILTAVLQESRITPDAILGVAIDGPDGAGKKEFADELGNRLQPHRNVIRASMDGFYNPPEIRYKRGRGSAEGCFLYSYDYARLKEVLLDPLNPGGSRAYNTAVYDVATSTKLSLRLSHVASEGDILILDGPFTLRQELRPYWDISVYLDIRSEVSTFRAAQKDRNMDPAAALARNTFRHETQSLYLAQSNPKQHATILIDNNNLSTPSIIRSPFPNIPPRSSTALLSRISRIRFKELSVPLTRWAIQVALFLAVSLLNNAAFGYKIPMAVHIIFRSGGLCVSMLMKYLLQGKKYSRQKVFSVLVVTVGIALATASASSAKRPSPKSGSYSTTSAPSAPSLAQLSIGLSLLFLALLLSALLGLAQEKTYAQYGKSHWQEGMFYLHFLAMPMFGFLASDIKAQIGVANASRHMTNFTLNLDSMVSPFVSPFLMPAINHGSTGSVVPSLAIRIPSFYLALALNVVTHVLCIAGVHRLKSRLSSLTVTLVLAIRKAVSLGISVIILGGGRGNAWLWGGTAMVLLGTVGYGLEGGESLEKKKIKGDVGREKKDL